MLDAHAYVMQVKLCKANTRGVTLSSFFLLGLTGCSCINLITLPWRWTDKSEICPLVYTVVRIRALRRFSCIGKWTVAFPHCALTGLVGRLYH